jgi:hypothetical protein
MMQQSRVWVLTPQRLQGGLTATAAEERDEETDGGRCAARVAGEDPLSRARSGT